MDKLKMAQPLVRKICARYCTRAEDLQDMVQMVLLKAWRLGEKNNFYYTKRGLYLIAESINKDQRDKRNRPGRIPAKLFQPYESSESQVRAEPEQMAKIKLAELMRILEPAQRKLLKDRMLCGGSWTTLVSRCRISNLSEMVALRLEFYSSSDGYHQRNLDDALAKACARLGLERGAQ